MNPQTRRFRAVFTPEAERGLAALPDSVQEQIRVIIDDLEEYPWPHDARPMWGKAQGWYRIRLDDYCILYQVIENRLVILLIRIGPRDTVYDGLEQMRDAIIERGLASERNRHRRRA